MRVNIDNFYVATSSHAAHNCVLMFFSAHFTRAVCLCCHMRYADVYVFTLTLPQF